MQSIYAWKLLESTPSSSDNFYKAFEECVEYENATEGFWNFLWFCDNFFQDIAGMRRLSDTYLRIESSDRWDRFEDFLEKLFNDTRDLILTTCIAIEKLLRVEKDTPENNDAFNFLQGDIEIIYRQARNRVCMEMNRLLDIESKNFLPKK